MCLIHPVPPSANATNRQHRTESCCWSCTAGPGGLRCRFTTASTICSREKGSRAQWGNQSAIEGFAVEPVAASLHEWDRKLALTLAELLSADGPPGDAVSRRFSVRLPRSLLADGNDRDERPWPRDDGARVLNNTPASFGHDAAEVPADG